MDDKAFLLLLDEVIFQIRVQDPNPQVPRDSHATTSSVDDHLALVVQSISSYLVVDRRNQGTVLVVLRLGVATLRGRSSLLHHSNDVPGLLSVTSVLVTNFGRHNGYPRANFGTKSSTHYNNGNRHTSMEVDVLTDLLATARDRRPDGQGPSQ